LLEQKQINGVRTQLLAWEVMFLRKEEEEKIERVGIIDKTKMWKITKLQKVLEAITKHSFI
jgi:uncharacterized membrane protein YjjP (DUF1212 family)